MKRISMANRLVTLCAIALAVLIAKAAMAVQSTSGTNDNLGGALVASAAVAIGIASLPGGKR